MRSIARWPLRRVVLAAGAWPAGCLLAGWVALGQLRRAGFYRVYIAAGELPAGELPPATDPGQFLVLGRGGGPLLAGLLLAPPALLAAVWWARQPRPRAPAA